ncbi:MAG: hypothetical protein HYU74_04925 [Dechloromonas sp.]|nr:hypothetical protein [Dechloromonas sp.]
MHILSLPLLTAPNFRTNLASTDDSQGQQFWFCLLVGVSIVVLTVSPTGSLRARRVAAKGRRNVRAAIDKSGLEVFVCDREILPVKNPDTVPIGRPGNGAAGLPRTGYLLLDRSMAMSMRTSSLTF